MTARPSGLPKKIPAWAWKWLKWRTHKGPKPAPKPVPSPVPVPKPPVPPKPKPKPKPPVPVKMLMFDDTNVHLIPKDAKAVAGYVDGHYRTWLQVEAGWPHAKKLMIAVFGQDNGDCLDVEPGDASVSQAAAWVKRQRATWHTRKHDVSLPVVYTSASQMMSLVNALKKAGLTYGKDYLLWSAHYDPARGQHLCSPGCGFGIKVVAHATQYTDHALGRSLDESVCSPTFFD